MLDILKQKEVLVICTTNIKNIEIWNDGNGGGTYIDGALKDTKLLKEYTEDELERLIDQYENIS